MGKAVWEMVKGDYKTKPIVAPAGVYTSGGKLMFAAKTNYDLDTSDAAAVVKKTLTDTDITETKPNGDKVFLLKIEPSDTDGVSITEPTEYIGEIQYVNASGKPTTYETFTFRLLPDINRRTT